MRRSFRWQFSMFNEPLPDFEDMETTTLVTFMLYHPGARTVELLGSWDNFSEPYRLERDSRKGFGHWTGCHTFKDIVCDGDLDGPPSPKRDGGLKQGGTYWYYYRLDGVEEHFNPAQPTTTSCPFLPGQTLNVFDVPQQIRQSGNRRTDSVVLSYTVHTLDPESRYTNPRPPPMPPAVRPKLPKLITPAFMDNKNKLPSFRDRPWTAGVKLSKDDLDMMFPSIKRNIKSASDSPSSPLRTAFSHLKGPVSALTPSQGGRGRSRTLHPDRARSSRTNDPSISEFRLTWPQSAVSSSSQSSDASPIDFPSPRPESPMELAPNGQQLLPKKRRSLQKLLDVEDEPETMDMFPTPGSMRVRGRSTSAADHRHHRRRSSEEYGVRRSSSQGRLRAPSPLRNVVSQDGNFSVVRIPEDIQEVDWEDMRSPRRLIESSPASCSPLDVNKELPALPSYLIPDPLFSRAPKSEDEEFTSDAALAPFSSPRSHFSIWSTASEDDPGSPITDNNTNSPTLSSVKDASTGVCTPQHSSPPQQSMDEFLIKEDLKSLTIEQPDRDPFEVLMDGKTPTAASFQLHGVNANEQVESKPSVGNVQMPHQSMQMQDLLDQFDYLGAAVL